MGWDGYYTAPNLKDKDPPAPCGGGRSLGLKEQSKKNVKACSKRM